MKLPALTTILEHLTPRRLFEKLTIVSKMLIGYMTLVALTIIVVTYALLNLQRLNKLNNDVVKVEIPIQKAADAMLDTLLAQDMYEKRYLILGDNDMRTLFRKRAGEFRQWMAVLKEIPDHDPELFKKISALNNQYCNLFEREARLMNAGDHEAAKSLSQISLKTRSEKLLELLRSMSSEAKRSQARKMTNISEIGRSALYTTAMLCILSIALGVLFGMIVTHNISSPLVKLHVATMHIAEGNFDYDPQITSGDETGALAQSFVAMGKRLRALEEMYRDASPLTRLPGGIAIENIVKRRLDSEQQIAFCLLDLDNFKAFNDHYGYAHGNEVLKETARIIELATEEKGTPEDFVGHIGGDDFVVITTPTRMRDVCEETIRLFDLRIPEFYNETDRTNGFIFGKTRQGQDMQFPLMTISIAVVTNEKRMIKDALEAAEIAAEIKDYAKTIPTSVYVVNKRLSA
jgi:diguanylate cyclase (GGDEF)-like protein